MKFKMKSPNINIEAKTKIKSISVISGNDISNVIKNYRATNKLSQQDLAKYSNVSRIAISEFENGKTDIRISTLLKILKVCSLSLEIKER
ncbi:MAG: helix-turn-helix transcriptional regulator [Spirochaetaceae bacterium]